MSRSFEEYLAEEGKLVYKTRGVSMEPMLRQNRDLVVIEVPDGRLKRYDVAFYRRGNAYVLHRVIRVTEDGCYRIRGDNTYSIEIVPESDIIGVLTGFCRKGKEYTTDNRAYRRYVRFWCAIYPVRALWVRCRRLGGRILRKLGLRK
ncbi:MAG: S24/S26 family peptidase [Lachnospiraceae bacterium]|nr:S24/S26 family peptidase [Lachnospiraceae bacterium]